MARRRQRLPQEPLQLEIEKLSHEGRGIAHYGEGQEGEGKVIFVDEALPGELVSAKLTDRRRNFDEARTEEVLQAAPERVIPLCDYAGICGGCSLQHYDSTSQLNFKEGVLHEKLRHALGREDYERLDPINGPGFGYRRKARLAVRYVHKKEQVLVGFREKRSSFITNMDHCEVLEPRLAALLQPLSALVSGMEAYREIPQVEVAMGDPAEGKMDIALVFRHLQPLSAPDQECLAAFAEQQQLSLYLQPGGVDTVHKLYPADGESRLYYQLPDFSLSMAFHPMDFTQVNADINRRMLARALALLELQPTDKVLDLFCGLGNFTLPIALNCGFVCGIEGSREMVERGTENACRNQCENVEFHCSDLSKDVNGQPWLKHDYNKVLLDPPRSGAMEVLDNVMALQPERIVYISCNPATLARDAELLEQGGYRLQAAGALDMFPQTTHVESMALFVRQ